MFCEKPEEAFAAPVFELRTIMGLVVLITFNILVKKITICYMNVKRICTYFLVFSINLSGINRNIFKG